MAKPGINDAANLEQLIDRQMRRREVREHLDREGDEAARRAAAHLPVGPYITISREAGSGGTELAHELAGRLGWQVYDRELLAAIARHDPSREKLLSRLDEHAVGVLEDFLGSLMDKETVSRSVFVREMGKIVWSLARDGNAVFVGRGVNWMLDPRYGLRVRVVAPFAARAGHLAREQGLARPAAESRLRREDEAVAAFVRQSFGQSVQDATGYDLVLNLGTLSLPAASELVELALRRKLEAVPTS